MPLDTDYQRLVNDNEIGLHRVWTARDQEASRSNPLGQNVLAGYLAFYVFYPPHHCKTLIAVDDGYYLAPAYRRGWAGVRMWRSGLDALAQLGVKGVIGNDRLHFQRERGGIGAIFRRLGGSPTDRLSNPQPASASYGGNPATYIPTAQPQADLQYQCPN